MTRRGSPRAHPRRRGGRRGLESGYGAARVSDIAARAGTSTGTVHYYYPTKVDVLDAALQHAAERSTERHRRELAGLSDPKQRLLRLIDLQLPDGAVADEWAIWLEFWNEARHREELRERGREVYAGWVGIIEQIVRDGVESGQFRSDCLARRLCHPLRWAVRRPGHTSPSPANA